MIHHLLIGLLQPMYNMPQPAGYGYPGFGTYGSFPGQAAGTPGAAGAGSPGMPQPAAAPGAGLGLTAGQQPNADPSAVAGGQAGQAQWGGADPSSYYNNYWGGKSVRPFCQLLDSLWVRVLRPTSRWTTRW